MTALGRSGKIEDRTHQTSTRSAEECVALAVSRIEEAHALYKPVWLSAGLSGGHDSVTATYIASRHWAFDSAFHIDTGVGLRDTETYVAEICRANNWPLEVFKALENTRADGTPDPQDYFKMIEEHGFPGPALHFKMYQRLKQRQIERFCRAHKKFHSRQLIMIVSGRRAQESARRTKKVLGAHEREGRVVWCNPLWDFSKLDCSRIMEFAQLQRSPVVDLIHKSGECLCGAFGTALELEETTQWFRDDPVIQRLNAANSRLRCKFGWGWGEKKDREKSATGPMCSNCDARRVAEKAA